MQSFKYSVPPPPGDRPPRRRRTPRIAAFAASLVAVGALIVVLQQSAAGPSAGLGLGWMLGKPAIAEERARRAESLLAEGERNLAASAYAGALKRFGEALRLNPSLLAAWDRARVVRYLQGERSAVAAAELVPDPSARLQLLLALGQREREAGRLVAARGLLEQALALRGDDARVHVALAAQLDAEGQTKEAVAAYDRALQLAPDDVATVVARFDLRLRAGELEPACAEAIAALAPRARKGTDDTVLVGLLEAYMHQGLPADEIRRRLASDAPQLGPLERQLVLGKAWLRHYKRNPNWHRESFVRVIEACQELRKAESGASATLRAEAVRVQLEAHAARARRFLDRSDVDASRAEVDRALALAAEAGGASPEMKARFADLHAERARLLTLGGKADEATRALEAAVKLQPAHAARAELARIQAELGMTLLSAGKTMAAIGHFRRAVALAPEDDGLLARYYQTLAGHDRQAAVAAVARAVASGGSPAGTGARGGDLGQVMARLAHGFSQAHKPAEARAIYALARSARIAPARLAEIQAEAQRAAGQRSLARKALLQAIEHRATPDIYLRLASVEAELAAIEGKRDPAAKARHLRNALEAYRHAIALAPDGPAPARALEISRELSAHALATGQAEAAERHAAEGRVLAPSDPALALAHADALVRLGRLDDAHMACAEGLTGIDEPADQLHAKLRLRHGQVLRGLHRYGEAIEALKLGLAPDAAAPPARCADLWYELAFAHAAAGQREEALNATRQYVFWSQHDARQKLRVAEMQELELSLSPS